MANTSRISQAADTIKRSLVRTLPHVYTAGSLEAIFQKNKKKWNLPQAMNVPKFIDALLAEVIIDECYLDFGNEYYQGYYLCSSSAYYIISQLVPKTYLSHLSALHVWGLTDKDVRIYINREQAQALSKAPKGKLEQTAIAKVFSQPQRQPENTADFNGIDVVHLKGKYTGQLGVRSFRIQNNEEVLITDLERTLIDCIVRPAYALPPQQMIGVFKKAKKRVSVATMSDYLDELDYLYPYHQCIGFYMERAGNYSIGEIKLFSSRAKSYDFYLDYELISPAYDSRWKLYYPASLKI